MQLPRWNSRGARSQDPTAEPLTAPLARRLASLGYEALVLCAVLLAAALAYGAVEAAAAFPHNRLGFQVFLLCAAAVYFIWHWTHGQTLPMKTWRIRLITRNGLPLNARRATLRFVAAALGLAAAGLTFVWAIADPDGQFLHDRIAGTRLVRTDPPLVSGGVEDEGSPRTKHSGFD